MCSEPAWRFGHMVKWARIWLAVSRAPQRRPNSIHGRDGRPRLAFESSLACARRQSLPPVRAYCEMRAHLAGRELAPQSEPHFIRGPGGRPRLTFKPPSSVRGVGRYRPLQANGEVRAHLANRKIGVAAPAAQYSPPRWTCPLRLRVPPPAAHVVRGCRTLRASSASCEVRAHLASGKPSAATPTAFHPRPG